MHGWDGWIDARMDGQTNAQVGGLMDGLGVAQDGRLVGRMDVHGVHMCNTCDHASPMKLMVGGSSH